MARTMKVSWLALAAVLVVLVLLPTFLVVPGEPDLPDAKDLQYNLGLLDNVGLYQKNGLVEVYGASLRQRRSGPISVTESILETTHDRAWVFWWPDHSPVDDATHLRVRLAAPGSYDRLRVGFILEDESVVSFVADRPGSGFMASFSGDAEPSSGPLLPPLVPEEIVSQLAGGVEVELVDRGEAGIEWVAPLPTPLMELFRSGTSKPIRMWFLELEGNAGDPVRFLDVSLASATPSDANGMPDGVHVGGQIRGGMLPLDTRVELWRESGERERQFVSTDGRFQFNDLTRGEPVSLRVQYRDQDYYSVLGRWLMPDASRDDADIDLTPPYVNLDGHAPDPKTARFIGLREPSKVSAFYAPHSRQYWPGAGKVQEYDSTTFTNNMGFIDRDRFYDNPDDCLRIVHLGGSDAVSLQVRPFEKYNLLMESELGVRLGRCVEVISAGRDNGDVGANYPRVRDYAVNFDPDMILLANPSGLLMQIHPELLRLSLGIDAEHNAVDSFYYDDQGSLQFRPWSAKYPLFTSETQSTELTAGVPLSSTLTVPFEHMHPVGLETWQYLRDILAYFAEHHPEQRFVLHTGLDQMTCRQQCRQTATLETGETIPMGAESFSSNHRSFCAEHELDCIDLPMPSKPEVYLTFFNDGHYSARGHQWFANKMADAIVERESAEMRDASASTP